MLDSYRLPARLHTSALRNLTKFKTVVHAVMNEKILAANHVRDAVRAESKLLRLLPDSSIT
jgi:hypothetical protein